MTTFRIFSPFTRTGTLERERRRFERKVFTSHKRGARLEAQIVVLSEQLRETHEIAAAASTAMMMLAVQSETLMLGLDAGPGKEESDDRHADLS